jgi:DNA-binding beta-propeller fold protein YncE
MYTLLMLTSLLCTIAVENTISSAAGTGTQGYSGDGGPAPKADLNQPFDVCLNSQGDVFLSDTFNHCIRKIDHQTGIISTVAGTGSLGFAGDDGPATKALLNEPYGVVVDRAGNLYFVDRLNQRIRKVDAQTGLISTVAGNGSKTYSGDGGPARMAGLVEPNGVAIDPENRMLYVADVAGHRLRQVDLATGVIQTFSGTGRPKHEGDGGAAESASIWGARAVDVGPDGTVFILEREGNTLRAVNPRTKIITTIAGTGSRGYSGDGGPALSATFNGPKELAVDPSGNVWIVDTENHVIRRIDAATKHIQTVAGNGRKGGDGDGGPANAARLDRPHGVAVGADGRIWIGDTNNHRIRTLLFPSTTP